MNSEKTPKEMVQSFKDLANMAKGLMDENQQPSAKQRKVNFFFLISNFLYFH